jgi:hypothetical protein
MRKIYQRDSAAFHLKATRRHMRLARKQKGAEKFADSINPFYQKLIEMQQLTLSADEKREDAYDDILHADSALDDVIRTTFENCKQHGRNNPGEPVLLKLFPDGTFSNIINMPYAEEPKEAERIAATIESLGQSHPIYPFAKEIRAKISAVNNAIDTYKLTLTSLTRAEVEEETAKASLRQQYEFNYLDSRKELGALLAERIFPSLSAHVKENGNNEPVVHTEKVSSNA